MCCARSAATPRRWPRWTPSWRRRAGLIRVTTPRSPRCGDLVGHAGPTRARELARLLAVLLQASLLIRFAPAAVADLFCATRLASPAGPGLLGALPGDPDLRPILARALP